MANLFTYYYTDQNYSFEINRETIKLTISFEIIFMFWKTSSLTSISPASSRDHITFFILRLFVQHLLKVFVLNKMLSSYIVTRKEIVWINKLSL